MRLVSLAQARREAPLPDPQSWSRRRLVVHRTETLPVSLNVSFGVALQRSGGELHEAQARTILIGTGPPVPPPQMAGLAQLKQAVPQLAPQVDRRADSSQPCRQQPVLQSHAQGAAGSDPCPALAAIRVERVGQRTGASQESTLSHGAMVQTAALFEVCYDGMRRLRTGRRAHGWPRRRRFGGAERALRLCARRRCRRTHRLDPGEACPLWPCRRSVQTMRSATRRCLRRWTPTGTASFRCAGSLSCARAPGRSAFGRAMPARLGIGGACLLVVRQPAILSQAEDEMGMDARNLGLLTNCNRLF
jgi:hypothetical protein